MANEMAHVGQYVLVGVNAEFKGFIEQPVGKGSVYKKGRDFYAAQDGQGNTQALGFKGPAAICADGTPKPIPGDTWQPSTSFVFTNGKYIDANTIPYVVLPQTKNNVGVNISPDQMPGNPFYEAGVMRGDYVLLRNPQNGKTVYAIYGENGPAGEVGEISIAAARALGLNPSPLSGGFETTSLSRYLQYEIYPGSGKRSPDALSIQTQSAEDIQKNGKATAEARGAGGGYPITSGSLSVFVGAQQQPAAFADPQCLHSGSCPIIQGSDTVSLENRPATRVGDACSCGQTVISGEPSVLVYGAPTSQAATLTGDKPISLWDAKASPPSAFALQSPGRGPTGTTDLMGPGPGGPPSRAFWKPPSKGTKALKQAGGKVSKK